MTDRNPAGGLKVPPPGGYARDHAATSGAGTLYPCPVVVHSISAGPDAACPCVWPKNHEGKHRCGCDEPDRQGAAP